MLPWDNLPSDDRRRKAITILMLILAFLLSSIILFVKVPKEDRAAAEAMPERIARVVERKIELPPPPPPKPKEEPKKEEEAPKLEEKTDKPVVAKPVKVEQARAKASKALQDAGLDQLASLRDEFDLPTPSGALITNTEAAGTSRAMLTSRAGSGSGALASAGYGAGSGQVSSGFGGGVAGGKGSKGMLAGGGKMQTVESGIKGAETAARSVNKDGKSRRTKEDIEKGFDKFGSRLYLAYQRAVRDDPNLQGTLTLSLTIAPDGSVTSCTVASSQLNNPVLEAKIVAIVKGFNFGADNVEVYSGQHTLNLFPD
ncbi:MAG TPA: energy transducer TonB [Moraxellaceae bacterium]|nr:energy transducer TonB [Moraxellaceae bacterium]